MFGVFNQWLCENIELKQSSESPSDEWRKEVDERLFFPDEKKREFSTNGTNKIFNDFFNRIFIPIFVDEEVLHKTRIVSFTGIPVHYMIDGVMNQSLKPSTIIHIFALLHATAALVCALTSLNDELLLTILSMALILIICFQKNMSVEVTALCIIIGNILGFFMGVFGANLFGFFIKQPSVTHTLATFCTTEVLGWGVVGFSDIFHFMNNGEQTPQYKSNYFKWLALAIVGIFIVRIFIPLLATPGFEGSISLTSAIAKTLSNTLGLIILTALNVIFIFNKKIQGLKLSLKVIFSLLFITAASVLEAFMVTFGLPLEFSYELESSFIVIAEAALLLEIMIFSLTFLANFAYSSRNLAREAKEKANLAQYRYAMLKQQLNPHFLFNSLNALDCLVCDGKTEEASTYIHKLAGVYRYLLKSEEEQFVLLKDEMKFVGMYKDLLSVRFPAGYNITIDIPEDKMTSMIIPCSIQLLLENAFKHNVISEKNPLNIRIEYKNGNISVSNNIMPKKSNADSTGLGMKYIRRQYSDLTDKKVTITNENNTYTVTIPLI